MDASVGLAFSLQLFQRYRRNGILQAQVHHVPGIQGTCIAHVHLTDGSITNCYLENQRGQRFRSSVDVLCRVDEERGPFEWTFQQKQPSSQPEVSPSSQSQVPPSPISPALTNTLLTPIRIPSRDLLVPKVVAPLRWEQFSHWTPEQKQMLQKVWKEIDAKRTVQNIKASLSYPPEAVNEILDILLKLRLIALTS